MPKERLHLPWLIGGFLLVAVIGCGPGRGDLGGKVSYQGKSLQFGSVTVLGSDGIPRGGLIQNDGSYLVEDIAAGPVKIAVTSPDPVKSQPKPRKKDSAPPTPDRTGWF